jgi:hypothetical protein
VDEGGHGVESVQREDSMDFGDWLL